MNQHVLLLQAFNDDAFVSFGHLQVMLGHEPQVEKRQILGVGIFGRNKLSQHIFSVLAEVGIGRYSHETLETLKKDSISSVLDVIADSRAHSVMGTHQNLSVVLHEQRAICTLFQSS